MSSTAYRFLTTAQVKRLHMRHIAKASPTQPAMLESAVNSPVNHEHYGQKDLFVLAGVLAEKIALDHSYQDGNKRTALFAADMFLKMNGHQLRTRPNDKDEAEFDEELSDAHVFVATRRWTPEDLGNYYRGISQALTEKKKES
ncbi:hypothetical protein BHE90_015617 [Fusarium euwallaceae]|uniref:Fido domain-containing protein n=2 Tax=Fusarium solani species complex TaxID=232080 RepID=A0A430L2M9_9HYPO|nr:hypothetical protein CEP51_015675 [Fusarium floridanum]RTE69994.1 hypothetical protein BHE90_015617 [Fusarium euwallaceae]